MSKNDETWEKIVKQKITVIKNAKHLIYCYFYNKIR